MVSQDHDHLRYITLVIKVPEHHDLSCIFRVPPICVNGVCIIHLTLLPPVMTPGELPPDSVESAG